jgi:Fe-S cluster biosynthesis and repair protein YggX
MALEKGKKYPEGFGKRFYSERCKEQYQQWLARKDQPKRSGGGCC